MSTQIVKVRTQAALDCFDGSVARLAEFFSIKRAAVYQWGDYVPSTRAYQLRDSFPDLSVELVGMPESAKCEKTKTKKAAA